MCRIWLCVLVLAAPACVPEYPMCRNDMGCRVGELCVDRRCSQCVDDSHCLVGERCTSGVCEKHIEKCASAADCDAGQVCLFEMCSKCFEDGHCPEGLVCVDGACSECAGDEHCPEGLACVDGACSDMVIEADEVIAPEGCTMDPVHFAFDSSQLSKKAKSVLDGWIPCLDAEGTYTLVGRADNVGDEGYNLSLGLDRAKAVKDYLVSKGVSSSSLVVATAGKHKAAGKEDAEDRRVDIL
jgi:peptidoglycan-associated lipoprotein